MKKIIILILAMVLVTGCSNEINDIFDSYTAATESSTEKFTTTTEITYSQFETKIKNKDSFVLLLWQTGCGHCQTFEPIMNRVISHFNIQIYSLNTALLSDDEYSKLKNKTFITGTPTTVAFVDGVTQSTKLVGSKDEQALIKFLAKYGYLKVK